MSGNPDKTAQFVALFAANNRRIYAFVRALVHNRADADEVFQETCTALWAKFDQYQEGSNFWSWACAVARFEALRFLRRHSLQHRIFSDAFYEAVENRAAAMENVLDAQQDALADCYAKLNDEQRKLIDLLYAPDGTPKSVALQLGRSVNAVYKSIQRVHGLLFDCIQERIKDSGRS